MAKSPSHRFGQVVGNLLEEIILPELLKFCDERGLYLDRHGARINVRKGKKVTWTDKYENAHDLDFVIEKGGSKDKQGRPVAFIEAAWRRYTKHSRAKAQEIQGAVLPVAEKHSLEVPFLGAVLAGIFTKPSLAQLESLKFNIVYIPYENIMSAFAVVGINAQFDQDTPDAEFAKCVEFIEAMPAHKRQAVKSHILASAQSELEGFFGRLRVKLDRLVERVVILPLFGSPCEFDSVVDAEEFIRAFDQTVAAKIFQKYEVMIYFSNKDELRGLFSDQNEAVKFLRYVTS